MSNQAYSPNFIKRRSFIELNARERASVFFDAGTSRELLGPFDRVESPWLPMQGVTPQADDGCVVMKGKITGQAAVVVALEGAFQGGSMGEVSGEKMTAALDLAGATRKVLTSAVILLETGGVVFKRPILARRQSQKWPHSGHWEARPRNLCYGRHCRMLRGMPRRRLCSYVVMTREARLGMNGPK